MWALPAAPQGVRAPPHGFAAANASQVGRARLPVKAPLVQQRGVLLVLLGAARLRHVQRRPLFCRGHKLIARGSQQELPPCACHGKLHGADVYIVGTAHISPQSIADVEELMSKVKPDAVVVELSRDRINSLYPMADSKSGSLQLDLDTTPGGFPVVLQTRSFDSETEGQLVIRHAAEDKVDVVNMRQPLASLSHSQWLEKAFQKHRYRSETVKIWPAIEFMMAMANQLFPLAQRAFYLSVGNLSQSGGEFAAAARAARQLRCPIILGDVENEDLFDPLGALEVTREDSWWVRLGGPLVRPHTGGVDLIEALKHVFAGTTKPGTGARIGAIYLALLVYGFYLDEKANAIHTDFNSVVLLLSAMSATNTLVAATLVFLLTATRDELLFRALAEAARTAVEKKGHGTVVLVCGVAHVNGIARYVAKANGSSN